jgi:dCTP deaminase
MKTNGEDIMILNDRQIIARILDEGMIAPAFVTQRRTRDYVLGYGPSGTSTLQVPKKIISMGVSSFGYDIQLGEDFKIFTSAHCGTVDPKNLNESCFVSMHVAWPSKLLIPPNGFVLGHSAERWKIPRDISAIVLGKSTYARCGLIVNCTPLEPEWEGTITLELTNSTPLPLVVYPGEGIAQALFYQNPDGCEVSYADRAGKYQGQTGLTLPKV